MILDVARHDEPKDFWFEISYNTDEDPLREQRSNIIVPLELPICG